MTINAIENNTPVKDPEGNIGKVQVTELERESISDGKRKFVWVRYDSGLRESYFLDDLTIIEIEEPKTTQKIKLAILNYTQTGEEFVSSDPRDFDNKVNVLRVSEILEAEFVMLEKPDKTRAKEKLEKAQEAFNKARIKLQDAKIEFDLSKI